MNLACSTHALKNVKNSDSSCISPSDSTIRQVSGQEVNNASPVSSKISIGSSDTTLGFFAVGLPLLICCAAVTSRKYRAFTLQRQIKRLEKIWQMN